MLAHVTHPWHYSQALCAIHLSLYMHPITSENWSSFQRRHQKRARVHEAVRLLTWQPPWGQRINLLNGKHCGCNIWTRHVMLWWYVNSSCIEACLLAEDWRERGKSSWKFYIYWFCRTVWKQSPVVQESQEWELSYWRAVFDHMSDKLSTFTNQSLIWSFTTKILSFYAYRSLDLEQCVLGWRHWCPVVTFFPWSLLWRLFLTHLGLWSHCRCHPGKQNTSESAHKGGSQVIFVFTGHSFLL